MSHNEKQNETYFTSDITPSLQNQTNLFQFSKETLTDAKTTLNDVINFARLEKRSKIGSIKNLEQIKLDDEQIKSSTGIVEFDKNGFVGEIRWWAFYPSEGGEKPPIIALHGGPSFNHKYMLPLKLMAYPEFGGYPVIFYDQCGCGGSTTITPSIASREKGEKKEVSTSATSQDIPPHLFTVEYYVEEFLHLLHCWNTSKNYPISFKNGYYLYGSSWGTILAQEVAVHLRETVDKYQTDGTTRIAKLPKLMGLFLDGALSDAQLYCKSQWKYRISRMPSFTYHLLHELEVLARENDSVDKKEKANENLEPDPAINIYETKTYKQIERVLSSMFTTRLVPLPDFWKDCLAGANMEIYSKMQGASEFTIGGCLKHWSIVNRLPCLSKDTSLKEGDESFVVKAPLPVLALAGEFDTMTIECHQNVLDSIGGGDTNKLVVIPRAGHCKLVDEPLACCEAVLEFMK